tara:strand:- start:1044 stop:2054 length:1011 start_codon:yes stop_codon:yes gene_type:complete
MGKIVPKRKYIVGAYATSPNLFSWNEKSEYLYYERLKNIHSIRGLELPFWGDSLHPFDDEWLLSNLNPVWQNILTCVPGTMKLLESNPWFGIASKDEKSRKLAIEFYRRAFDSINLLKKRIGQKSIIGIALTSSPFNYGDMNYADNECFMDSLIEIISWNWGDVNLYVEHCDAETTQNTKPKKGFLSIEDEIEIIGKVNNKMKSNIGMIINWGRSVIEGRDINVPIHHIQNLNRNKILTGLMFSGTTNKNDNLYGAWSDLHMPPTSSQGFKYFEPQSLMSYENIRDTLKVCDIQSLGLIGIKLLSLPESVNINRRIGVNKDTMKLLNKALNELYLA